MNDLAKISDLLNELQATNDRLRELLETCKRTMEKYNFPTMLPVIKAIEEELSDGHGTSN